MISSKRQNVFDYLIHPKNMSELLSDSIEIEPHNLDLKYKLGTQFKFSMTRFGLTQISTFKIDKLDPNFKITYVQTEGLFVKWKHTMLFEDHSEGKTLVTDIVDYTLPGGIFGFFIDDLWARKDLKQMLEKRLIRAEKHFSKMNKKKSKNSKK